MLQFCFFWGTVSTGVYFPLELQLCKSEYAWPTNFQFYVFLLDFFFFENYLYLGIGLETGKKFFWFITWLLFLQNMKKTVFIVVRKIVGMIVRKSRISGLSQSVSCPFADKQAFSVQFRSMDRGEKMCLGDRF